MSRRARHLRRRRVATMATPAVVVLAAAVALVSAGGGVSRVRTVPPSGRTSDATVPTPDATTGSTGLPGIGTPATGSRPAASGAGVQAPRRRGASGTAPVIAKAHSVRVVFSSTRAGGKAQLYVMQPDGSGVRRITNDSASDVKPSWSPDGRKVVFVSDTSAGDPAVRSWQLRVVDVETGSVSALATDGTNPYSPAWSPDGRSIAYSSFDDQQIPVIRVLDLATGASRSITDPGEANVDPTWSPDSTRLAFVHYVQTSTTAIEGRISIASASRAGSITQVTAVNSDQPAWSPDGTRIAYRDMRQNGQLWTVDVVTGGTDRVTATSAWDSSATWLDTSTIVFDRDPDGHDNPSCAVGLTTEAGPKAACSTAAAGPQPSSIWRASADGTRASALTSGTDDFNPAIG